MNVFIVNTKKFRLSYKVLCITFALQILSTRIGLAIVLVWYILKKKNIYIYIYIFGKSKI